MTLRRILCELLHILPPHNDTTLLGVLTWLEVVEAADWSHFSRRLPNCVEIERDVEFSTGDRVCLCPNTLEHKFHTSLLGCNRLQTAPIPELHPVKEAERKAM